MPPPTCGSPQLLHSVISCKSCTAPPLPGQVIHNGLDCGRHIGRKEPFVLAAGRLWDEGKNIGVLAAAAGELRWPVKLAGAACPDERFDGCRNVELLGELPRAELLNLMERASIFAAPALYEPFGLGILEAASAGCALVLSDIPTLRELWSGAAVFVDPRNSQELSAVLQRICGSAALRTQLQRSAARRARRYGAATMTDAYCLAYRELLGLSSCHPHAGQLEATRGQA